MSEIMQNDFQYYEVPNVSHILRTEAGEPILSTYEKQTRQPVDSRILNLTLELLRKQVDTSAQQKMSYICNFS